ncbi:MAG: hypothetical protein WBG50_00355 [Desulfomonilaceae bacterium]
MGYVLTRPVRRDWHQPAAALVARAQQAAARQAGTPFFTFALGPSFLGAMTYTQNSATTGTIHLLPFTPDIARFYSITIVGPNGLSFPLTATIAATTQNAAFIQVRQDGVLFLPETVTFPNSSTLTRQVPPYGNSGGAVDVPQVSAGALGTQGTITITAPGVQALTITVVAP